MGAYVSVLAQDGEFSYIMTFARGEILLSSRDARCSKNFTADYSDINGLPESVKFYNPHNDAFYCLENVKKLLKKQ